jgi:ABC-type lipoprotein export system ATPase subunit
MLIDVNNIHKRYKLKQNDICVLDGADLMVDAGETVAVVGRSGAGKSTLLHILGGLDRPDKGSGQVLIGGGDLYGMSASKRSRIRATTIGFVFQSYHLLNEMDVLENVMLPARGIGIRTAGKRAIELLDAVGVADRAHHTPMELSGGEQQRVALARALINNPSIILADEPTGNLDEETGLTVLELLFKMTKDSDHALVMVTHSKQIASTCDRTLFLADGKLGENSERLKS